MIGLQELSSEVQPQNSYTELWLHILQESYYDKWSRMQSYPHASEKRKYIWL